MPLGGVVYFLAARWRRRMTMRASGFRPAWLVAGLMAVLPAAAQVGHPVKGAWSGYWGPNEAERNRILLVLDWVTLDWNEHVITGTINPGRNAVAIDKAEIDYDTWTLTIEADMPVPGGGTERYVATGTVENLGSWTNRRYSGTYTLGDEEGTFRVTLN
jgi:hypothetical protein